jgi:hypothetical protein
MVDEQVPPFPDRKAKPLWGNILILIVAVITMTIINLPQVF